MVRRNPGGRSMTGGTRGAFMQAALLMLACLAFAVHADAADWQGKEVAKEGVTHVMNPAKPVNAPESVSPKLLWKAGGDDEEYIFGVIGGIASGADGTVYLLDSQLNDVKVFSSDGTYLRSIGREGEGPGEFRRPSDIFLTAKGDVAVIQPMPGKIILLTPAGEPDGNFPAPDPPDGGMQMFGRGRSAGDRVVLATMQFRRQDGGMKEVSSLVGIDAAGAAAAEYLNVQNERNFANMVFNEKDTSINNVVFDATGDGRVYINDEFDAYRVKIYSPSGAIERVVEREYEPRVRSDKEREENKPRVMIRSNNGSLSPEVQASKTDRAVMQVYPRPDGTLWVLSSRGAFDAPAGAIGTFDVFDRAGRFVKQITIGGEGSLRQDGIYLIGDRLFVVKGLRSARRAMFSAGGDEGSAEEEAEPVSVLCYDLASIK